MAGESIDLLEPGDEAPPFDLEGTDGERYTLDDFADYDALLVVFTCNHCPYAKAKQPVLNAIAADYDDLAVVGVNPNDNPDYPDDSFGSMQARVEDGTIALDAYLFDPTQVTAKAYGAVCTPDPFLFENDGGTFRLVHHARLDDAPNPSDEPQRAEMREAIDAVLAGEEIPVDPQPSRGCTIKWQDGNEPEYWATL